MTLIFWFLISTLMTAHIGIAYSLLLMPGNLLDWIPGKVERIKNPYLQDLLTCSKCISGQCALWCYILVCFRFHVHEILLGVAGGFIVVSTVIVLTDQLMKRYGYA